MWRRRVVGACVGCIGLVALAGGVAGALGAFDPSLPPLHQFGLSPVARAHLVRREAVGAVGVVAPFVPVSLSIPALGLHRVRVIAEGDPAGTLTIPPIQDGVAWWDGGAQAGAPSGTTLIAGHVDWVGFGNGPLERIWYLRPGTVAVLYGAAGQSLRYVAVSLRSYLKSSYARQAPAITPERGPNQLVMVTCGGTFSPLQHQWNSDVVATFLPLA